MHQPVGVTGTQASTQDRLSLAVRTDTAGKFPKSPTTARAIVLAGLLSPGEDFGTAAMFPAGAIGLHTVMRALMRRYKWPIIRRDVASINGWVTLWSLPKEAIDAASVGPGAVWLECVRSSRQGHSVALEN